MAMKSATSPRRLYVRAGSPVVCYGGLYFGPARGATQINAEKTVKIEVLPRSHGKARIAVTQGETVENWGEQHLVFANRG